VAIGIAFVGEAIHSEVWVFGLIGAVLMIQGAMNTGCNNNCEIDK
jgi:hypothetical protein